MTGEDFDTLVRFFDGMAQTKWLSDIHDQLKEATGDWENKNILDVGCATGRLLLRGVEDATKVVGIDLSESMVTAARELFHEKGFADKAEFFVADAYTLPFGEQEFDLVLSTCVLFLLPEPEKGLKEMVRVVKDKGKIAMLNPGERMNPEAASSYCEKHGLTQFEEKTFRQWSNVSTQRHRYNKEELTALLNGHGAVHVTHIDVADGLALVTVADISH